MPATQGAILTALMGALTNRIGLILVVATLVHSIVFSDAFEIANPLETGSAGGAVTFGLGESGNKGESEKNFGHEISEILDSAVYLTANRIKSDFVRYLGRPNL